MEREDREDFMHLLHPPCVSLLLVQFYRSLWLWSWSGLVLWELRVVTVLEVSSSSPVCKASLKNWKMELKLLHDVSSCRSVPAETRGQSDSIGSTGVSRGSGLDTQLRQCCCSHSWMLLLASWCQTLWIESVMATAHTLFFT